MNDIATAPAADPFAVPSGQTGPGPDETGDDPDRDDRTGADADGPRSVVSLLAEYAERYDDEDGVSPTGDDDGTPPDEWSSLAKQVAERLGGGQFVSMPNHRMPRIPTSATELSDNEIGDLLMLMNAWDAWLRQAKTRVEIEVSRAEAVVKRRRARFFSQWRGPVTQAERVVDNDPAVKQAENRLMDAEGAARLLDAQRSAYSKSQQVLSRIITQREAAMRLDGRAAGLGDGTD